MSSWRIRFTLLAVAWLTHAPAAHASDLVQLTEWMTGSFSSAAQADADEDYGGGERSQR